MPSKPMGNDISRDDIERTADLLGKFKPGFLPYPVFEQIARLIALPIIEFIPLRLVDGKPEVLLIARPADDPFWPGMLHTPGTVIRSTDLAEGSERNWPAFQRILDDELEHSEVGTPHYVGSIFHHSKRGAEQAQLYWIEVTGKNKVGDFYQADQLSDDLMESQRTFIQAAVKSFLRQKH